MRYWLVITLSLSLLAGLNQAQSDTSSEVLGLINEARLMAGIAPVFVNDQLVQAAQDHSADMARTGTLSHLGSNESQFWERAARAGYTMTNGAQNVLARGDLSVANTIAQWQQNPANNANLLNSEYDEIGFAYAPSASGTYYYTLLLGTRADFVAPVPALSATPVLLPTGNAVPTMTVTSEPSPTRDSLILTLAAPLPPNTPDNRPTRTPDPFATPTATFFPTATPALVTGLRLYISPDTVVLQNTLETALDIRELRFASDTAVLEALRFDNGFLTTSLSSLPPGDCLQVWGLEVQQPLPRLPQCDVRHGWIAVGTNSAFWRNTPQIRVLRGDQIIGMCPVSTSASVCDLSLMTDVLALPVVSAEAERPSSVVVNEGVVRILIEASGITLENLTGSTLDLSQYRFEGGGFFEASAWNTANLSRPLNAIPSGDCLQIWSNQTASLTKPPTCRYRHGWVGVQEENRFWSGAFSVYNDGTLIGRCEASVMVCDLRP